jgi:hypothetical protein
VIGFSLPLQWPDDGERRAEMEGHVLAMIAMQLQAPPEVVDYLRGPSFQLFGLFVSSVAEHWPTGATRPPAVTAFLTRYDHPQG